MKVNLAEQIIDEDDVAQLISWLKTTQRYTKGPETVKFEEEWSSWLGTEYSVLVNSGSSANLLMFLALLYSGKLRNKKVIVPAVSWVTTVSPAIQLGFESIICDCDEDDLGFSVEHFEELCKKHNPSSAILVHVLGHAGKLQKIREICAKYDVILLEDACEAPGSVYSGQKVGNFGLASSFSFFYGHQMSTIEGGMVSTNDRNFYNLLLSLRSHGWLRDNEEYFRAEHLSKYDVTDFESNYFFLYPGLNVRSTDLNAFIGRNQLKKMGTFVEARNKNHNRFQETLKDHLWVQKSDTEVVSSLGFGLMTEDRETVVKALTENEIECRPLICGSIQEHPFWTLTNKFEKSYLPNADKVHKNGLYVPCHQSMTDKEVDFICQILLATK
jgi:CDP-6-deoxy-D-xylo-4-hexulose-3-dehydrase